MTRAVKTKDLITSREVVSKIGRESRTGLSNGIANKCYNNIINKSDALIERKIAREKNKRLREL